jgi:protein-S-isoprenylcysteine O-methyltransferase Ste14
VKRLARWASFTLVVGGGLFVVAGRWRDPWLWAYVGVTSGVTLYAMLSMDEALGRERYSPPSRGADALSLRTIRLVSLAHLIAGALDAGRFHWTSMPDWLRVLGLAGFALSFGLVVQAMKANRFFSAVVRVQDDRGHHVIDQGPYAVVRHPGYAGMIPAVPFSGLALGSWIAFAIALVYSVLIVRRVQFEDRFLHENLPGYPAYAQRVRDRLVPGLW